MNTEIKNNSIFDNIINTNTVGGYNLLIEGSYELLVYNNTILNALDN